MSQAATIPERAQVLVIGGGPGGSYSATCLAREGVDVVLLESTKFPRYHIGESMLPSMRNFLRFIDFLEEFEAHGFKHKNGAAFKLNAQKRHGFTDFLEGDEENHAWNVLRSESDHLLLKYASRCGVKVFEETRVKEIKFDGSRPVAAVYKDVNGDTGTISFDYLIDASGRNGVMSTKYLKSRVYNPSFKNIALWGYWTDVNTYKPDDEKLAGFPFFEALTDDSGWAWFIPLHNGTTSIGIVTDQDLATRKKAECGISDTQAFYHEEMKLAPSLLELIGKGKLVISDRPGQSVKSASDYSYSATSYAGSHYRLVGDAACFIDPYFSSGVHLALSGGLSAAATILASMKGSCTELEAANWHNQRVDTSYTRFLVVVLTAYRQIRDQSTPILSAISEDGFDRAFDHFRTVIQGRVDVQKRLVETGPNIRQTIEFCKHAFDNAASNVTTAKSAPSANGQGKENQPLKASTGTSESTPLKVASANGKQAHDVPKEKFSNSSKQAITDVTAMRFMTTGDSFMIDNIISESFGGLRLNLQKGGLGLVSL